VPVNVARASICSPVSGLKLGLPKVHPPPDGGEIGGEFGRRRRTETSRAAETPQPATELPERRPRRIAQGIVGFCTGLLQRDVRRWIKCRLALGLPHAAADDHAIVEKPLRVFGIEGVGHLGLVVVVGRDLARRGDRLLSR
jgi:hypothetical protein